MRKCRTIACLLSFIILCVFLGSVSAFPQETYEQELYPPLPAPENSSILLTVDYTKETVSFSEGQIILEPAGSAEKNRSALQQFKEMGYTSVEVEINPESQELFPDPGASPLAPESYDFKNLDEKIKEALEMGDMIALTFEVSSWPSDITGYCARMDGILKHLLKRWGGGYSLTDRELKFVVLDIRPDDWQGHEEDFFRLYGLFALSVKKLNSAIAVGGPGFAHVFKNEQAYDYSEISPLFSAMGEYLKSQKVPLDILLLRHRGMMPYGYFLKPRTVDEKVLKDYAGLSPLYGKPRIALRAELIPASVPSLFRSTVLVNALSCIIKGGAYYALVPFESQENNAVTQAFSQLNFFRLCPSQLETVGLDRLCFTLTAARSKDGKKACFVVSGNNPSLYLTEAPADEAKGALEEEYRKFVDLYDLQKKFPPLYTRYHLYLENLPWEGRSILFKRYILDGTHSMTCVEERTLKGMKELYFNELISLPAVQVISLEEQKEEEKSIEKNK